MKCSCNWTGTGSKSPSLQCQLCDTVQCCKLNTSFQKDQGKCQLCGAAGHIAKACGQLQQSQSGN